MSYGPYPWAIPVRNTSTSIAKQSEATYLNYEKTKEFEDIGYFLVPYVVSGGVVTKDITSNNVANVSEIVVTINNNLMNRDMTNFKTKSPSSTYFLDFTKDGDYSWGTAHAAGIVNVDYVAVAEVNTDVSSNISTIVDKADPRGGFRLKSEYGLFGYMRHIFDVLDYGAKGDGVTVDTVSIQAAVNAAAINGGIVAFSPGTYVTVNVTVPSNVTLWFTNGAKLSVSSGATITINGYIDAGEYQIFSGLGTIVGTPLNNVINGEWFGIPIVTTSNGYTSLQAAITFCQQANKPLSLPNNALIRLDTQVIIQHGKNSAGDQTKNMIIHGNNATIYPNFNGAAFNIQPQCTLANIGTGYEIANVKIEDITFDGFIANSNGFTTSYAMQIGRTGYRLDGFLPNQFNNILSQTFNKNAYQITSSRMIEFNNVIGRSSGLLIECLANSEFCGDLTFNDCQFLGTSTNRPVSIVGFANGGVQSQVRGLRFNNCVVYGTGTYINASTNSNVGDIWFESCAWDEGTVAGEKAIEIAANGTSLISQVFFQDPYIVNFTGQAIYAQTDGSSKIEHFKVMGGHVGVIDAPGTEAAIRLISIENALIHGVTFTSITGQEAISVDSGSAHISIQNNSLQNSSGLTYFVTIGTVTDFILANNIGTKPMNDASGAVNKLVVNNLTTTV